MSIVDVWMQHPTARFLAQPMFESLRRWTGQEDATPPLLAATIAAMEQAGVATGLVAAWHGPQGELIANDEVAAFVREHPARLPAELVAFMRGHGMRKVMFGTNYPMLTAAACLEGLAGLGLGAEAEGLFLAGNARRVFRLATD